jgi:hypothetical protein
LYVYFPPNGDVLSFFHGYHFWWTHSYKGITSGGPPLHGLSLLVTHSSRAHFWWLASSSVGSASADPILPGFTSGDPLLHVNPLGSSSTLINCLPIVAFILLILTSIIYYISNILINIRLLLSQVANAPSGTQACTFDIEKFHRTCPVLPAHKPWLVVQGLSNDFYIDHTHPFGAAAASSNAGMIGNAIVDIWQAEGVKPILKYEDDLKIFRYPVDAGTFQQDEFKYEYDRNEALSRISSLHVPWHKDKGDLVFSFITNFIGFRWDLPGKLVSLPTDKRLKFHNRVRNFLDRFSGHRCSLLDVQKIHGSLCHIAFVYVQGRSRLPSLSNFISSFNDNEYIRRYPSRSMITDLKWWLYTLDDPMLYRKLLPRSPCQDLGIFVDASTSWGIGIIIGGKWMAFRLHEKWKIEGRDICWLETVAVEILIYILEAMGISNTTLLIHSDNQGTIGSLGKGRSRNFHINLSIRRACVVLASQFITPDLIYIASENNPADPISRGVLGSIENRITNSFSLPDEIRPIFLDVA